MIGIPRKGVPTGLPNLVTAPSPAQAGEAQWEGVRPMGQGPYPYSQLVRPNRAMSGLGNGPYKAIALDVETGQVTMPPRLRQPAALANPTYRISWLEEEDLKKRDRRR